MIPKNSKLLHILVSVFAVFFLFVTNVKAFSGAGNGDSTPYEITTCDQLQEMINEPDKDYILMKDIDCSETSTWNYDEELEEYAGFLPVGSVPAFTGTLDGDGFTISNLYVNRDLNNGGLFGVTSEGSLIKNLNIDNADITAYGRAGTVVGVGTVTLDNVHVTNSAVAGDGGDEEEIGGLIGFSYSSSISNSSFNGTVSGKLRVGGLVGYEYEDLTITDSSNSGDITGYIRVGGLVGSSENSVTISGSNNSGAVLSIGTYSTEYQGIGGLVGASWKADITESFNTGDISTDAGGFYVGGILGGGGLVDISSCSNTGDITSGATAYNFNGLGGIVGSAINVTITDSYNKGNITETTDTDSNINIGGLLGFAFVSSISNTYNTGIITQESGTGVMSMGGIIGQEAFGSDIYSMSEEYSGKDFWGPLDKVFKFVSNFNVGDIFKLGDSFAGGLIGFIDVWDGDASSMEINNNWWSNNIDVAIGHMDGISVFSSEDLVGKMDKEEILSGFKTYTHKVYNTDPSWDFDTIWSNVYDTKDYPILAFQDIIPPQKPVADKSSGRYTSSFQVSLVSYGSSKIMYTTDGTVPTCTSGILYSSPFTVSSSVIVKAIGCDSDNLKSDLGTFEYTVLGVSNTNTDTGSNSNIVQDEDTEDTEEETNTDVEDTDTGEEVEKDISKTSDDSETEEKDSFNYLWLLLLIPFFGAVMYFMYKIKEGKG